PGSGGGSGGRGDAPARAGRGLVPHRLANARVRRVALSAAGAGPAAAGRAGAAAAGRGAGGPAPLRASLALGREGERRGSLPPPLRARMPGSGGRPACVETVSIWPVLGKRLTRRRQVLYRYVGRRCRTILSPRLLVDCPFHRPACSPSRGERDLLARFHGPDRK